MSAVDDHVRCLVHRWLLVHMLLRGCHHWFRNHHRVFRIAFAAAPAVAPDLVEALRYAAGRARLLLWEGWLYLFAWLLGLLFQLPGKLFLLVFFVFL